MPPCPLGSIRSPLWLSNWTGKNTSKHYINSPHWQHRLIIIDLSTSEFTKCPAWHHCMRCQSFFHTPLIKSCVAIPLDLKRRRSLAKLSGIFLITSIALLLCSKLSAPKQRAIKFAIATATCRGFNTTVSRSLSSLFHIRIPNLFSISRSFSVSSRDKPFGSIPPRSR